MKNKLLHITVGAVVGFLVCLLLCGRPADNISVVDTSVVTELLDEINELRSELKDIEKLNVAATIDTADNKVFALGGTTFEGYGSLEAKYWFFPINSFDFRFSPTEPNIIIKPMYLKPRWYNTRTFGIVVGAFGAATLFYLVNKK